MPHLSALGLLLLAADPASAPSAGDVAPLAETAPSDDGFLREVVRALLPENYVDEKEWGGTTEMWDGLRVWWENGRLETKRRKKLANHGLWSRHEIRLTDPQRDFDLRLDEVRDLGGGRVGFRLTAVAGLQSRSTFAQWAYDVQLWRATAEARSRVRLVADCSLAVRLDASRLPPDVVVEPRVERAELILESFELERLSRLGGAEVGALGEGVQEVLDKVLREKRDDLPAKFNRAIAKRADKLRFSLADYLESGWSAVAGEPAEAEATP